MRRRGPLTIGCGLLALTTACSPAARACTAMGGTSGVSFDASALPATAPLPWQVTSCADDVCQDAVLEQGGGTWFDAENADLGADPVAAHLRVVAADGAVLVDSTARVGTRPHDVNGNGCGPLVWRADVVVGADGTLTAAPSSAQP